MATIGLGGPASPAAPEGIAFGSSSKGTGSKLEMSVPEGASPGDLLVAGIAKHDNVGPRIKAPPGWTQVIDVKQSSDVELALYTKTAGASEVDDYTWGTGDPAANGVILSYSGVDAEKPVLLAKSERSAGPEGKVSIPSLKVLAPDAMLVLFAMIEGPTPNPISPPPGFTERAERAVHPTIEAADMPLVTPGATGKKTAKAKHPGDHIAILLALAPADAAAPADPSPQPPPPASES